MEIDVQCMLLVVITEEKIGASCYITKTVESTEKKKIIYLSEIRVNCYWLLFYFLKNNHIEYVKLKFITGGNLYE